MRVALLTAGSRGDVQPFVALGRALLDAGHSPVLAASQEFAGLVSENGVPFAPLRADFEKLATSVDGRAALSGNPVKFLRQWRTVIVPMQRAMMDDAWAAAQGADVLVFHPKILAAPDMAERLSVPCFVASPVPTLTPTAAFPAPALFARNLGSALNRATYALLAGAIAGPFGRVVQEWSRDTLGFSPRRTALRISGVPALYACSRHLVPRPADWPDSAHLTGFWFLGSPSDWRPPSDLEEFLSEGPPPVYVGFGSMAARHPAALARTVLAALRDVGHRVVLATGWGGMEEAYGSPDLYSLRSAPHEWLFPRIAAAVHHGGAGTTAAALRAGRPSVICPFFGDQPFWGRRVAESGAGTAPIPQKRLTAARLASAVRRAVSDPAIRRTAEELGAAIRSEGGAHEAVRLLEAAR